MISLECTVINSSIKLDNQFLFSFFDLLFSVLYYFFQSYNNLVRSQLQLYTIVDLNLFRLFPHSSFNQTYRMCCKKIVLKQVNKFAFESVLYSVGFENTVLNTITEVHLLHDFSSAKCQCVCVMTHQKCHQAACSSLV